MTLLIGVYAIGGVGYRLLSPSTPFIDCLYMSVITVASVGYAEVIDSEDHPALRAFTMTLILFGMAVHLYGIRRYRVRCRRRPLPIFLEETYE